MRIELANRRSLREFVMPGKSGRDLIIPREMEKQFFEVNGDTRAGKSTLIRKMVKDILARGETCIFVDPKCEFVRENYHPERGDMILNFMDDRVYRWLIEREAMSEAGFKAVSVGMLPAKEHEQPWFNEHAQSIIAYLLNRWRAEINCQNLGRWLAEDKKDANGDTELDRRVAGSEHAITLAKDAPGQRSGVRGTLSKIGNLLRMCPTPDEGRPEWSVRDWAEGDRKGWIFITCTAETKDALLPLMTLWLDMFLLALQSGERRQDQKRTWVIIDELTVLQRVPKLPEALMLNAAGDNPIVLGFQSMSMVQKIYGHDQAEAMLSQSYTRFILRAREPRTAEHSSKVIGTHSVEKITATKSKQGISYSTHEAEDPLVRPRDIQTLRNMRGYFVHGDMVVKIRFKRDKFVDIAPGWIERKVLEVEEPIVEELPAATVETPQAEEKESLGADNNPFPGVIIDMSAFNRKSISDSITLCGTRAKPLMDLTCKICKKKKTITNWPKDVTMADMMARHGWEGRWENEMNEAYCGDCCTKDVGSAAVVESAVELKKEAGTPAKPKARKPREDQPALFKD